MPEEIMEKVRLRYNLDANDTSKDEYLLSMSKREIFESLLEWEGIQQYGNLICSWIEDIWDIQLIG